MQDIDESLPNLRIMEEFRNLRWAGTLPEHLDYPNTQFLRVGESSGIKKAMQPAASSRKNGSKEEEPIEEMKTLESEDKLRIKALGGADAIFADLHARANDYPKLKTTF